MSNSTPPSHTIARWIDDQTWNRDEPTLALDFVAQEYEVYSGLSTFLELGVDLFTNVEPSSPDNVMTIYDTGGPEPSFEDVLRDPTIQVRTRGNNYAAAYALQQAAFEILNTVVSKQLADLDQYVGAWLITDIAMIGTDDNARVLLTSNYQLQRYTPE